MISTRAEAVKFVLLLFPEGPLLARCFTSPPVPSRPLLAAGLRMAAYFDYVPSKANIADLPSRGEMALPRALGAEVARMQVPTHTMLSGPLRAWLDAGERHGHDKDWPT